MSEPTVISAAPQRSKEQLETEMQWISAILSHAITNAGSHKERISGTWAYVLVHYYIAGVLIAPNYGPHFHDMDCIFNVFSIAPPHVQDELLPLVEYWKRKIFDEDDKILDCVDGMV